MQPTLEPRANVILGPDQALGPKMDPRVEKKLTAAKTQILILLLHNVGDLSNPGEARR